MIIIPIAIATLIFTMLGGLFALKLKDKLHYVLGFSAGTILGVAFFDLLPESIILTQGSYNISSITPIIVVGFVFYMLVDRYLALHIHSIDNDTHDHTHSGVHGASALSLHSFLDGLGIGLAFKVSPSVGAIVAAAVLSHGFSDGINTVNYILKNKGTRAMALRWLVIDALAPVLGVISSYFIVISQNTLGLLLALFCGFFLYMGASDLLPESHHQHPKFATTFMTILGILVVYFAVRLAEL